MATVKTIALLAAAGLMMTACGKGKEAEVVVGQVEALAGTGNQARLRAVNDCPSDNCDRQLQYGFDAGVKTMIGTREETLSTGRTVSYASFTSEVYGGTPGILGQDVIDSNGQPTSTGSASWNGFYNVSYLEDPVQAVTGDASNVKNVTGPINVTVDLDQLTLTGQSGDNRLAVNGTITNNGTGQNTRVSNGYLTGTSTFDGVTGDLAGNVASNGAIGAVAGQSLTLGYAGGFVAN